MKDTRQVYLDHAAATPVDRRVVAAMQPYWTERFYNPSALYLGSKQVKHDVDAARGRVAQVLGVRPTEITFCAGGTEANNIAIHGVMAQYPTGNVVVSAIEHDSVLRPAAEYAHHTVLPNEHGVILLDALSQQIDDQTVLVSIMHANNELGTIQPIKAIAGVIALTLAKRQQAGNDTPLYLHVDASQSANYLTIQPHKLGVDLLTINGGKIYGPKQSAVLFARGGVRLQPLVVGGGQERGLRSGTENVAAIVGIAQALEMAQAKSRHEVERLGALQRRFIDGIQQIDKQAIVNGRDCLVNFMHVTFPGQDNERLVMELDERGIQCAVGSACSASSDEPSHVLSAIGLDAASAQASVRFTMGRSTTVADIDYVLQVLTDVLG